jgi:hypothetical protein
MQIAQASADTAALKLLLEHVLQRLATNTSSSEMTTAAAYIDILASVLTITDSNNSAEDTVNSVQLKAELLAEHCLEVMLTYLIQQLDQTETQTSAVLVRGSYCELVRKCFMPLNRERQDSALQRLQLQLSSSSASSSSSHQLIEMEVLGAALGVMNKDCLCFSSNSSSDDAQGGGGGGAAAAARTCAVNMINSMRQQQADESRSHQSSSSSYELLAVIVNKVSHTAIYLIFISTNQYYVMYVFVVAR